MVAILDLDGVIWLAGDPIAGSAAAVRRLRAAGQRVLFLTNNSSPTVAELVDKLGSFGVDAAPADVVTSAQAAASLVEPGQTALVCGGPGVVEALEARGAKVVTEGDADAVVVGFHRDFDYQRLTVAFKAVYGGARLIGTNNDASYPMPDGPVPGGGAILAAVATAAGVTPVIAGKPNAAMADLVRQRVADPDELANGFLAGDRPSTDGLMARRLGLAFVHLQSGVDEPPEAAAGVIGDLVSADLAAAVEVLASMSWRTPRAQS